jgi:hypothetical protein
MLTELYIYRMAQEDRERAIREERGRGVVRALYSSELRAVADARRDALAAAEKQLDKLARLLPDALAAGLTLSEVARLSEVSRPTLYELKGRFGEEAGDLQLGILQAIANRGYADRSEIEGNVYRSADKAHEVVEALLEDGYADSTKEDREGTEVEVVYLTDTGMRLLEQWTFANYEADDESGTEPEAGSK